MGWDVLMVKPYESNDDSLDEERMRSFSKDEILRAISRVFGIEQLDTEDWIDYENEFFSISFDLSSEKSIMLYTELLGDDEELTEDEKELMNAINSLSKYLNCRVFDTTKAEFII